MSQQALIHVRQPRATGNPSSDHFPFATTRSSCLIANLSHRLIAGISNGIQLISSNNQILQNSRRNSSWIALEIVLLYHQVEINIVCRQYNMGVLYLVPLRAHVPLLKNRGIPLPLSYPGPLPAPPLRFLSTVLPPFLIHYFCHLQDIRAEVVQFA